MTADLEEAGGVGEAEQSLCHRLDPPRTMASVRNSGALSQEELELRMQAGPAFCSWSLSIKKKKNGQHSTTEISTHPQKQRGEHDGHPQSPPAPARTPVHQRTLCPVPSPQDLKQVP